jgi:hypothetical protein
MRHVISFLLVYASICSCYGADITDMSSAIDIITNCGGKLKYVDGDNKKSVTLIVFDYPRLSDADIKATKNSKELIRKETNQKANDNALYNLNYFTTVKKLVLSHTAISDAGLFILKDMKDLEELVLSGTININGVGLSNLKSLDKLKTLDLSLMPNLSDSNISGLESLTQIEYLDIGHNSQLTDAALAHIGKMEKLKKLNLMVTSITNDGLMNLKDLQQLDELNLLLTKVDEKGREMLHKELPNCKIQIGNMGVGPGIDTRLPNNK